MLTQGFGQTIVLAGLH